MTRKDYELIADALATTRRGWCQSWDPNLFRAHHEIVRGIAACLAAENPRFDPVRFRRAAGIPDDDSSFSWAMGVEK